MMVLAGVGCVIEQPFEAGTTEDEEWIPSIQLVQNDYKRIVLNIDRPPRLSLLRNITRYEVLLQSKENLSIVKYDTIPGSWISPAYLYPLFPHPYYSGPVLNDETEYLARVELFYRSGVSVRSNVIELRTPPSRGNIMKVLPLPQKIPGSMWSFENAIAFHGDDLIVLRDDQVFRVDTADGTATLIKDQFLPPEDYPNKTFRSFAVVGDTLVTYYFHWKTQKTTLVRLSFESLAVDSSIGVSFPDATPVAMSAFEGGILFHLLKGDNRHQLLKLDPGTGGVLHEYPPFAWSDTYWNDFTADRTTIWVSLFEDYDNRYVQIDPTTGSVVRELLNPIFRPQSLAFDGSHFWQVDTETDTIVKVRPAGF